MKRNEVIQVRVSPLEKEEIERRAETDVATYLRSLALGPIWAVSQLLLAEKERTEPEHWEDEGLSTGAATRKKSQPKGEGLAGATGTSAPRAEPQSPEFVKLVKQLEAQPGISPEQARERARKRLGL
jgi:hypothetical protein